MIWCVEDDGAFPAAEMENHADRAKERHSNLSAGWG